MFIVPGLPKSLESFWESSCGDDLVALMPDEGTLQAARRRLNQVRLLTQEIFVRPPVYEEIDVEVEVTGTVAAARDVRKQISQALRKFTHPLFGGPQRKGWGFGDPVRPSELLRVAQQSVDHDVNIEQVGIRKRETTTDAAADKNFRCDCSDSTADGDQGPFNSCDDLPIADYALIALRDIEFAFVRQHSTTGGLL